LGLEEAHGVVVIALVSTHADFDLGPLAAAILNGPDEKLADPARLSSRKGGCLRMPSQGRRCFPA
jgi:hypothetical protein